MTSLGPNRLHLFSFPSFFYSFPFGSQTLKTRTLRNDYIFRKNWKVTGNAKEKVQKRSENLGSHLRVMLDTQSTTPPPPRNPKTLTKTANPGEEIGSDFHSCHIFRFKSPVFNRKITSLSVKLARGKT